MLESNENSAVDIYYSACEKYTSIPPIIILKINIQRRGVVFSKKALDQVNIMIHQVRQRSISRESEGVIPVSFMLRDGTSVITRPRTVNINYSEPPLLIDNVDNKLMVCDCGIPIEEVFLWESPDYYRFYTSTGKPMWKIASARPQRIDINPYQRCDFWSNYGRCKFCEIGSTYSNSNKLERLELADIYETIKMALKEKGRFSSLMMTGGACLSGDKLFQDEVDYYVSIFKKIAPLFKTHKFPSQLIGVAYDREQLERIYSETGLMSFTADIEVLDEKLFDWICPGKSKTVGYGQWKERLFQARDIFGVGYVNTGIVGGVELAYPNGYKNEELAVNKTLQEAESLMKNGINVVSCVWRVAEGSFFKNQRIPSLDYYVSLTKGLFDLRQKNKLCNEMDDYRRCGNHPDTDLGRMISDSI